MQVRIGADIGGTFTDLVFLDSTGAIRTAKVSSTPDDYGRAILDGMSGHFAASGTQPADVTELAHGTTVATNTVLERKGAHVGLLTTRGFRDVLEIRRVRMPVLYDLQWEKPQNLVRRALREEVDERMGASGTVSVPLDIESARAAIARLQAEGVDAVAICFLHSYANDCHERAVAELARQAFEYVSVSSDVLPEMREYERTATTVIDAYVKPVVNRYLGRLNDGLRTMGCKAPVSVMQSNGGVISERIAASQPVRIIESGPAAGVIAARAAGTHAGYDNVITFDMGGTTAKASIIERGEMTLSAEYEVGGGINQGSRLIKGGGYLIRVPAIDIAEVGAGGGSIAWTDAGGALRVGPESSGAEPGPACYGRGGDRPTVTDANVVLGFLNPDYLVGGDLKLDRDRAVQAIEKHIARPLGLDVTAAAMGVHRVANAMMMRAIRSVSIERGRDPRDFALMAFGGNGPVHAAGLAAELEISRIVVPPWPGLFSALGLLVSDFEQLYSQSCLTRLDRAELAAINETLERMTARASGEFAAEGFSGARLQIERFADLRYRRQTSEMMIPLPDRPLNAGDLTELAELFHREHARTYGYDTRDESVEIVAVKLRVRGLRDSGGAQVDWRSAPSDTNARATRSVSFGSDHGTLDAPVIGRGNIGDDAIAGPVIVEEYDSTIVVPPDWRVSQPVGGFLSVERCS